MKKICILVSAFLLMGCAGNMGKEEVMNESAKTQGIAVQLKNDESITIQNHLSKQEFEEVQQKIEKFDLGVSNFDYRGKEHCFHPRGTFVKKDCTIEVQSDPHDYFVYHLYVYRSKDEVYHYVLNPDKADDLQDFFIEQGFERTDL